MTGACTMTQSESRTATVEDIRRPRTLRMEWTSNASGVVTATTSEARAGIVSGTVMRVTFKPGAATPSNGYDVTITDENGIDILVGQGANLSNAAASTVCPGVEFTDGTTTSLMQVAVFGVLTLNVANAGNAKQGIVELVIV